MTDTIEIQTYSTENKEGAFLNFLLTYVIPYMCKEHMIYTILQFSLVSWRTYTFTMTINKAKLDFLYGDDWYWISSSTGLDEKLAKYIKRNSPDFKGYELIKESLPTSTYLFADKRRDLYERLTLCRECIGDLSSVLVNPFTCSLLAEALIHEEYDTDKIAETVKDFMAQIYLSCPLKYKPRIERKIARLTEQAGSFNRLIRIIRKNIPRDFWHSGCFLVKVAYRVNKWKTVNWLNIDEKTTGLSPSREVKLCSGRYRVSNANDYKRDLRMCNYDTVSDVCKS